MVNLTSIISKVEGMMMNPEDNFEFSELILKTEEYERLHLSENTRTSYLTMYRLFVNWCQQNKRQSMPCSSETLSIYITYLAESGKLGSIDISIIAIERCHEDCGLSITGNIEMYRKVRRGILRAHPRVVSKVKPIRYHDLAEICRNLNPRSIKDIRDRAILTLGFFGGMRRSEIVALDMLDIDFNDNGIEVTIMRSKKSKIPVKLYMTHINDQSVCPIWSMKELFSILYEDFKSKDLSIFRQYHTGKRLSSHAVAVMIRERFGNGYSGHSLRRGLITSLSEKGVNMNEIKKISRHKNLESVSQYVEVVEGYQKSSGVYLES